MLINVWCWWDSNRGSLLSEATALPHFHECRGSFESKLLLRVLLSCTTQLRSVKVEKGLFEIKTERSKSFFATHFPAKSCRQKKVSQSGKIFSSNSSWFFWRPVVREKVLLQPFDSRQNRRWDGATKKVRTMEDLTTKVLFCSLY